MRYSFVHLLLFICTWLVASAAEVSEAESFLFDSDKYVQEIKTHNELESVLQYMASPQRHMTEPPQNFKTGKDDQLYVIMYYADWCPHCHRAAPIWKAVASYFHCTPNIRFFAFECSMTNEDRIGADGVVPAEACREQTVKGFPNMFAYWRKSGSDSLSPNISSSINPSSINPSSISPKQPEGHSQQRVEDIENRRVHEDREEVVRGSSRHEERSQERSQERSRDDFGIAEEEVESFEEEEVEFHSRRSHQNEHEEQHGEQHGEEYREQREYGNVAHRQSVDLSGRLSDRLSDPFPESRDVLDEGYTDALNVYANAEEKRNSYARGSQRARSQTRKLVATPSLTPSLMKGILIRKKVSVVVPSFIGFRDWIVSNTPITSAERCESPDLFGVVPDPSSFNLSFSNSGLSNSSEHVVSPKRWPSHSLARCPDGRLHDALIGFLYLLRNWVAVSDEGLTSDQNQHLQELLKVAVPLLPGRNVQLSLRQFHLELKKSNSLSFDHYQKLVDSLHLGGLSIPSVGVQPELLELPRLTSAIWLFFHELTVSLTTQRHTQRSLQILSHAKPGCAVDPLTSVSPAQMVDASIALKMIHDEYPVNAWGVAKAIRTTVANFFGCEVCRVHFTTFFDLCATQLCDWVRDNNKSVFEHTANHSGLVIDEDDGVFLWLWRIHNAVTFRTAAEKTASSVVTLREILEKEAEGDQRDSRWAVATHKLISYEDQDVRFPPKELCQTCRRSFPSVGLPADNLALLSSGMNISRSAFVLSADVVDTAVQWELLMRGMQERVLKPVPDSTWDRIEDFDLRETMNFLTGYLWREEWMDVAVSLTWDGVNQKFNVTRDLPGRRLVSASQLAADVLLPVRSSNAGAGLLCFVCLSFLIASATMLKSKRACLSAEVMRTMGLRSHSKACHLSPCNQWASDIEEGFSDGFDAGRATGSVKRSVQNWGSA